VIVLDTLRQDLRYALRQIRVHPAHALLVAATLALGIGANTAMFSAVNAVVLRPLPFRDPGRLYMLWEENPVKGWNRETAAPANMFDWKAGVTAFQDMAAYADFDDEKNLTGEGEPHVLHATDVTGDFFSVLGVAPRLGRGFHPEETWQGSEPVVVLSDATWRDRFGADPGVVGRTIRLDGVTRRVVGVMPAGFHYPNQNVQAWLPMGWDPASRTKTFFRRAHWLRPIARLRPGATVGEARKQLAAVAHRLQERYPETNRNMSAGMTPLHRFVVGDTRTPLLVLLGAVGLLLLLACANVANLLLVRASGRAREMAVRLALGAQGRRLVRLLMTESLLLSVAGGAGGVLLGWWGTRVLERLQPHDLLRVAHFGIDPSVLGFAAAITILSGLLFGLAPALWARRADAAETLREGRHTGAPGRSARRTAGALVVAEVALALLLVTGAGLLVRSFWHLQDVNPGFDAHGVLSATVELPGTEYDTGTKATAFFRELVARAGTIPGVESVGATSQLPLIEQGYTSDFSIEGRDPDDYGSEVIHRRVTPGYFRTMRVPVLEGRALTDADRMDGRMVTVINQALARRYFPNQDPVGQRIAADAHPDSTSVWRTIVGVVGSERQNGMAAPPQIEMLVPVAQDPTSKMSLLLRTAGDPTTLVPAVRRLVQALDPELPLFRVRTLASVRNESLARQRYLMALLLVFAGVALVLAIVGVYGVTAQAARQRTREIGIRMALGARLRHVLAAVVGRSMALIGGGLLLGSAAALLATRAMTSLLFQVSPDDPPTYAAVAAILAAAGLAASWLPARRAARVDPMTVLREE
jgi:putative ABC transport system permease protein